MIKLQIPFHELDFTSVRSRGPGGQNVNKTNSAVILRWNILSSEVLSEEIRHRLLDKLASKLTVEGDLIIRSESSRDQNQNRSQCLQKLHEMIQKALFVPKKRVPTKPTFSAKKKRLEGKKNLSEKKALRQKVRG